MSNILPEFLGTIKFMVGLVKTLTGPEEFAVSDKQKSESPQVAQWLLFLRHKRRLTGPCTSNYHDDKTITDCKLPPHQRRDTGLWTRHVRSGHWVDYGLFCLFIHVEWYVSTNSQLWSLLVWIVSLLSNILNHVGECPVISSDQFTERSMVAEFPPLNSISKSHQGIWLPKSWNCAAKDITLTKTYLLHLSVTSLVSRSKAAEAIPGWICFL